ncbi:MAG: hypothetical protein JNN24_19070 [Hyphomicrobium zavarzinii]|jgi:hypothetical protein|uniref:hypothetical protein n=1 Tax=Hyphomicrobium TaxID=81 RepID=UPI001A4ECE9E|nr:MULTISPECIES: hypothetical protein [Hyphomicrobium]MBL8847871.1 hypothetical protein [Hyphomicrobium zavarzinii]WBT39148.1 hypothetical protein PE058_04515 [Hyphomicrobium sp. DMF-1]HML43952.1 hypothetical protein [Hyphomicrobium zavarzinii]
MIRSLSAGAAALLLTAATVQAQDAHTTRIEPSNAYGATVTIEEGVRVFRPLPSERHVIVNPGGRTPLSLNYYDPVTGVPVRGAAPR